MRYVRLFLLMTFDGASAFAQIRSAARTAHETAERNHMDWPLLECENGFYVLLAGGRDRSRARGRPVRIRASR